MNKKKISIVLAIIFAGLIILFSSGNKQENNQIEESKPNQIAVVETAFDEIKQIETELEPEQSPQHSNILACPPLEGECEQTELPQTPQEYVFYEVLKVIDGDTLNISRDGKKETLRLIGIDTPETVHPSKPVECFGIEASNKAKETLAGQSVRLEQESSQGIYDKYNRLLAYVFLKDGTNFNKMMIEEGYAYEYTYSVPYEYQAEFKQAEANAKVLKKGLWADGVCQEEIIPKIIENTQVDKTSQTVPIKNICSSNKYNCGDFSSHAEAQATYEYCGGSTNDIHRLDRDKDGVACESLP